MANPLAIIAEALHRVEYKLDELMRHHKVRATRMELTSGMPCPGCNMPLKYEMDLVNEIAVRRCGCTSGMLPPVISILSPINGTPNEQPSAASARRRGEGDHHEGRTQERVPRPGR